MFYGGLVLVCVDAWRRNRPPRPGWGSWTLFVSYFIQGLIASALLRWILIGLGIASWTFAAESLAAVLSALLSCLVVALVEEALFRGFLLGRLAALIGWGRGAVITSLLFASVHLFRPGEWEFKVVYGVGLFLLGYLLSAIAWEHDSILAAAGFHGGVILLNLTFTLKEFEPGILAGYHDEPASGALSIALTTAYLLAWNSLVRGRKRSGRKHCESPLNVISEQPE